MSDASFRCRLRCLPPPPPHLFFLQHVSLAKDLHGIDVTRIFLLHQTHLEENITVLIVYRQTIDQWKTHSLVIWK